MGNDFQNLAFADWEGKENGDLPNPPLKRKDVSFDEEGNLRGPGFIYHTPLLKSVALAVFFEKTFLIPLKRFLITIVFDFINRGGLIKDACELFSVSYSSVKRWRKKFKETGDFAPMSKKRGPYKLNIEELQKYLDENQDSYQTEIAKHFNVTPACILIALKRLAITRKKSQLSIPSDVN